MTPSSRNVLRNVLQGNFSNVCNKILRLNDPPPKKTPKNPFLAFPLSACRQYEACNHLCLDSHYWSTNIIITTLKSFGGRQVPHKSSAGPRAPSAAHFLRQKRLCTGWATCLEVHWGDREQWQTNELQAYQQLFLAPFLSPQCSAGELGQRDTMSPSVSIVAAAGRRSWPCGRRGFIGAKEIVKACCRSMGL